MQHKHLFKKYFITSLLFFVGLVVGFFLLKYIDTTFRVQDVEISGATSEDKKILSHLLTGLSTLTTPQSEITKIVHDHFPTMEIIGSSIQFPHALILTVAKDKPFAYLRTDEGYIALSKNGIVVGKERSTSIPYPAISFYQTIHHSEYQTGQQIGFTAIERALIFISLLESEGYQTETVAIDSVDMIACKTKGFEVAFSQSRPIETQSYEVRQIIRQIKVGALRIGRLDLRFDKPVVQLPQK